MNTAALTDARRILYVDAIRANIDAGTWERLEPAQRIDDFDHVFLWSLSTRDDILLPGRMLPSRDAKGRDKYPLVLCAELRSPDAAAAVPTALRRLDTLGEECAGLTAREDFIAALDGARANAASILFLGDQAPPVGELVASFMNVGPAGAEGLARCLYALQRELMQGGERHTAGTGHVRLPAAGLGDAQTLCAWLALIRKWLPELRGVLLIKPKGRDWVDALVPIPLPTQLACIRTDTSLVPLACDVPYNLDPQMIQKARSLAASLM